MNRLFIAEKPSMGRAIAQGLDLDGKHSVSADGCIHVGNDTVTWLFGHILEQFSPDEYDEKYKKWKIEDLPIIPSAWKLKVKKEASKQFKIVSRLAKSADVIVNAGDPDREGQLLVDELLNYIGVLNTKKIERILLNALDVKSIRGELKRLRPNSDFTGLRNSALARQRADWLIGMNLTRIYSMLAQDAGYDLPIRVGRVKTPTMGLVVRREIAIRTFKPKNFFTPLVTFHHANGDFVAKWKPDHREGVDEEGRVVDKQTAERILAAVAGASNLHIIKAEQKEGEAKQRLPFSLSTLQVEAGKKTGFSPQKILDVQQALYEKKLTTYPRSDCEYLPENQFADAQIILAHLSELDAPFSELARKADPNIRSRAWNDKKISAHHAIIPTTVQPDFSKLSAEETALYTIIVKAYIAQFYPPQKFLSTHIEAGDEDLVFVSNGKVISEEGWKEIYHADAREEEKESQDDDEKQNLPLMQEGDIVTFAGSKLAESVTKPPSRFTGATLIQAMKEIHKYVLDQSLAGTLKECSGIGTEATRAGMIEELERTGFIAKKGKYFVPTEIASTICRILPETLIYPDLTAQWENALEKIGNREMSLAEFGKQQEKFLSALLSKAKDTKIPPPKNVPRCPVCHKPLHRRKSKKGTWFWSCSGYPDCKKIFADEKGKPGKEWIFKD